MHDFWNIEIFKRGVTKSILILGLNLSFIDNILEKIFVAGDE